MDPATGQIPFFALPDFRVRANCVNFILDSKLEWNSLFFYEFSACRSEESIHDLIMISRLIMFVKVGGLLPRWTKLCV